MLTLKPAYQRKRAVLTGPPQNPTAKVATNTQLRLHKLILDTANRVVIAHLVMGALEQGDFVPSGDILTVQLDTYATDPDPRRHDTWGQLLALAPGGNLEKLALGDIETVIRKAALLDEVERLPSDP